MSFAEWIDKVERWLTPAPHVIDRLIAAKQLPLDDPERKVAQRLYDQEYGQCKALEDAFRKKWRRLPHQKAYYTKECYSGISRFCSQAYHYDFHILSLQEISDLAYWLCAKSKVSQLHGVAVSGRPWSYYSPQGVMIYMEPNADLAVVVHEIAHHIHFQSGIARWFDEWHGEEFVRIELMLFHLLLVEGKLPTINREKHDESLKV